MHHPRDRAGRPAGLANDNVALSKLDRACVERQLNAQRHQGPAAGGGPVDGHGRATRVVAPGIHSPVEINDTTNLTGAWHDSDVRAIGVGSQVEVLGGLFAGGGCGCAQGGQRALGDPAHREGFAHGE